MEDQAAGLLRGEIFEICIATAFLVLGMAACAIAVVRRRGGVRIFLWLGIWSAAYGMLHLLGVRAVMLASPPWIRTIAPYVMVSTVYSLIVVASLAWLGLVKGILRRILSVLIAAAAITAILGIGWFVVTGVNDKFMPLNNFLAVCVLSVLIVVLVSKKLFRQYLQLTHRGFLVFGTLMFALEAVFANLARPLGFRTPLLFDHLGFLALLVAFGYSALDMVVTNERRLLTLDGELEVARQIQSSILPTAVPDVRDLRIAATYQPMTSVAGDFYEFLPVDHDHAGFLVADVCGHGVPAALIASMLKVAVQSVAPHAHDPSRFLGGLNRILAGPLRGQLVSAAYLWVDMQKHTALYSAAGHPPLLRWNSHGLEQIESNGLLFGVMPDAEYPVREISLEPGNRLLLSTDGITEPENSNGTAFGDGRLAEVLRDSRSVLPGELSQRIVAEIGRWQSGDAAQQDDMTLVVIDVLPAPAEAEAVTDVFGAAEVVS